MSFTGLIRTYLVAIALLPPVLMMAVVYFYSERQQELAYRQRAAEDLQKLVRYRSLFRQELVGTLERVLASSWFILSVHAVRSGGVGAISVDAQQFDLDFLELLDSSNIVLGSSHRPGLVGEKMELYDALDPSEQVVLQETVEYDIKGRHAALTGLAVGEQEFRLYGGLYLSRRFQPTANQIVRGTTAVIYSDDPGGESRRFSGMEFGSLYQSENTYEAVLSGGGEIGFHMIARFEPTEMTPVFNSFMNVVGLVALVSVLGAIALGVYISGRARREIDNLVDAFTRVAAGDLSTAVMAYEEGEFAQLADSFSEMMQKLRDSQNKLATSEKIAAWQTMARKIAHEIKNPLTPIGISVDDLRRSHQQKLPHFDQTVESSTRMIRSEVDRLCRLLDQFESFARMIPPVI